MGLDQNINYNPSYMEFDQYFRKVNFLQGYFEREYNMDNLEVIPISEDDMYYLYEHTGKILELVKDGKDWASYAKKYLPTKPGFFYGSYDYNGSCLQDVKDVFQAFQTMVGLCNSYDDVEPTYTCWY